MEYVIWYYCAVALVFFVAGFVTAARKGQGVLVCLLIGAFLALTFPVAVPIGTLVAMGSD